MAAENGRIGSYSWDIANINVGLFSDGAVELPEGYTGTTEFELRRAGAEVETAYYGPAESRKGVRNGLDVVVLALNLHFRRCSRLLKEGLSATRLACHLRMTSPSSCLQALADPCGRL